MESWKIIFYLIDLILGLWALYRLGMHYRQFKGGGTFLWALVIIFVPIVGPLLFLALSPRTRKPSKQW